jgi:hypothetical protein
MLNHAFQLDHHKTNNGYILFRRPSSLLLPIHLLNHLIHIFHHKPRQQPLGNQQDIPRKDILKKTTKIVRQGICMALN